MIQRLNAARILLFAVILVLMTACSTQNVQPPAEKTPAPSTETVTTPIKVVDGVGKEITFDKKPGRIVSLMPSNTEILFALGVGDKVVGVTDVCDFPQEATTKTKVSNSMTVNIEAIVALKPDVVFAYAMGNGDVVRNLEELGLKVVTIKSAATIDDVYSDIELFAKITGTEEKGKEIVAGMKQKLEGIVNAASKVEKKKQVYLEIAPNPDIWTAGSGTFQDETLKLIGVENTFSDVTGWSKVSEEAVIKRKPEVILTTVDYVQEPEKEIMTRKSWQGIPAVKNKNVFYVDSDLTTRPGPRIVDGIEVMFKAIYPDLAQ
ncbi:ABC transporter substrate-binding protein [Brevibacillus daliensis]|uniref:ABC transporter substrate-binding protein n=1 Tax=Brevibacillus daliensis TaxID=2892995 RepID=UPI001E59E028|nr:ABC transporter substrate-binding protein [Brevibacillus daliensis]